MDVYHGVGGVSLVLGMAACGAQKDASAMTDEQVLLSIQKVVSQMNDGSMPDPDAAIYTLGLSSMAMAQFSGRLEQVWVLLERAVPTQIQYLRPFFVEGKGIRDRFRRCVPPKLTVSTRCVLHGVKANGRVLMPCQLREWRC